MASKQREYTDLFHAIRNGWLRNPASNFPTVRNEYLRAYILQNASKISRLGELHRELGL